MSLYMKQDFSPPILSRRWFAMKFRPNMILYSRDQIISILESGLLFREDSIDVELETPTAEAVWLAAGGGPGWLTRGERAMAVGALVAAVAIAPPTRLSRTLLLRLLTYALCPAAARICARARCACAVRACVRALREYLALARRAIAAVKECRALAGSLGSASSALESTHTMLCRQQSELAVTMSRASSALLGNAPWLRADVAWHAVDRDKEDAHNLLKIHHAYLVVQSTLLKHIAMAHYIPSVQAQRLYKNHNERIYWLHTMLIPSLTEEVIQNHEALERMYRLLKNYGNDQIQESKKPGTAITDSWYYSEVHNGIARAGLELKLALNQCNNLDKFLDSCALANQTIDLDILNKDIDGLIDSITKCLNSTQNSQMRLKKLQNKFKEIEYDGEKEDVVEDDEKILKIYDKDPEAKDEVFYFIRTDDNDDKIEPAVDLSTAPGKKEKETTKIVLNELKRKLVRREDVMRERERQALAKTMPELKKVPEFPRQIQEDLSERKGYISKILQNKSKRKQLHRYTMKSQRSNERLHKYKLKFNKYSKESEIKSTLYEANVSFHARNNLLSFTKNADNCVVTKWCKDTSTQTSHSSSGISDVEANATNKTVNQSINPVNLIDKSVNLIDKALSLDLQNGEPSKRIDIEARNYRFTKKDLELSPSSSESDFDSIAYKEQQMALLKDIRRHRAVRRKNIADKRANRSSDPDLQDEGLQPMQYSMSAGLSLAAVLRSPRAGCPEEQYTGAGQLSPDSGNDERP